MNEFGIQFCSVEPSRESWILVFEDGYGGGVEVEGGVGNFCFLINKDKLARYLGRPDCL